MKKLSMVFISAISTLSTVACTTESGGSTFAAGVDITFGLGLATYYS